MAFEPHQPGTLISQGLLQREALRRDHRGTHRMCSGLEVFDQEMLGDVVTTSKSQVAQASSSCMVVNKDSGCNSNHLLTPRGFSPKR